MKAVSEDERMDVTNAILFLSSLLYDYHGRKYFNKVEKRLYTAAEFEAIPINETEFF
jgi:hypothetical protein